MTNGRRLYTKLLMLNVLLFNLHWSSRECSDLNNSYHYLDLLSFFFNSSFETFLELWQGSND